MLRQFLAEKATVYVSNYSYMQATVFSLHGKLHQLKHCSLAPMHGGNCVKLAIEEFTRHALPILSVKAISTSSTQATYNGRINLKTAHYHLNIFLLLS